MKNSETLFSDYKNLEGKVNKVLNEQISKNLGKRVLEDDEIEESCEYVTFIDDLTGENIDFRFVGVDSGGNLLGVREDESFFDTGTLTINNILLRCKIEIIEMLESL